MSVPLTAMALTKASLFGFQLFTEPSAFIRAILFRVKLPTFEKEPPIYQPPAPSETIIFISPSIDGNELLGITLVVDNLTKFLQGFPT